LVSNGRALVVVMRVTPRSGEDRTRGAARLTVRRGVWLRVDGAG
jgi:hypothetical protein